MPSTTPATLPDHMVVCTHLEWVYRDVRDGVAGRWPLTRSRGHDVPLLPAGTTAWWTPTSHAARLRAAGLSLPLACVSPHWLAELDTELTGRTVTTAPLHELAASSLRGAGFLKPATAKLDQLHAAPTDDLASAAATALVAGAHRDTWVQFTPTLLELDAEYRAFVTDGRVVACTAYRDAAGTPWHEDYDARVDLPHSDARRFVAEVAEHLYDSAPHAWVLDVARTTAGRWLVLEANAPWSAGAYGADLSAAVDCAVAASTGDPGRFAWQPDPHEAAAARHNPLRR